MKETKSISSVPSRMTLFLIWWKQSNIISLPLSTWLTTPGNGAISELHDPRQLQKGPVLALNTTAAEGIQLSEGTRLPAFRNVWKTPRLSPGLSVIDLWVAGVLECKWGAKWLLIFLGTVQSCARLWEIATQSKPFPSQFWGKNNSISSAKRGS